MDSQRLKLIKIVIISEAVLLALCLIFATLEFSHKINNKASLFADSIRNDFLLNDQKSLLQKIQVATISHDFEDIVVATSESNPPSRSDFLKISSEIPILSIPERKDSAVLARMVFSYSLVGGLINGLKLWLLLTSAVLVISPFLKKNLEEFLAKEIEIQKMRELNNLSARVAHDIRSPLSALNSLIHGVSNITPENKKILSQVSGRINSIADELLAKGKEAYIERSQQIANGKVVTALRAALEKITKEKSIEYRNKPNFSISLRVENLKEPTMVSFPEKELMRIISNLINNSAEAIQGEGEVTIQAHVNGSNAIVTIIDTGSGISEEVLAKLFNERVTTKDSGSGIGISSAYHAIQKYGGDLKIQSRVGVGTHVTLYIPTA